MESSSWLRQQTAALKVKQTLALNEYTLPFGLSLSEKDALALVADGNALLKQEQRIELGAGILARIIRAFCDSPYINQHTYCAQLIRLQQIFYHYKNEMDDEITDDELLNFMKEQFDGVCFGDLEYLEGTCLELFIQAIHAGYRGYTETDGLGEYAALDEVPRWDSQLYLQELRRLIG